MQHEVYAIHLAVQRLAPEKSAGWDRRGWGYERDSATSKPATFFASMSFSTVPHGKRHLHVAKRAWCAVGAVDSH